MPRIGAINVRWREVADFEEFATHLRALLDQAHSADVVLLPELVTFELMSTVPSWREATGNEPVLATAPYAEHYRDFLSEEARRRQQYIAGGSHLVEAANGALLNVAPLFDHRGSLVMEHGKSHLFPFEHSLGLAEGGEMTVHESPHGVLAINILAA